MMGFTGLVLEGCTWFQDLKVSAAQVSVVLQRCNVSSSPEISVPKPDRMAALHFKDDVFTTRTPSPETKSGTLPNDALQTLGHLCLRAARLGPQLHEPRQVIGFGTIGTKHSSSM